MTERDKKLKMRILKRDNFTCQKCNYRGLSSELEAHHKIMKVDGGKDEPSNIITLCSICHYFSPDDGKDFLIYIMEKIDGSTLDTFRKSKKSISNRTKKGMASRSKEGNVVSRAPFGYKIEEKNLIPHPEKGIKVQELFQEFLNKNLSLTKLSKNYNLSVNGLKKILKNQTYLGKIKFDGQTHQGTHQALISSTLFNHVQNKLEKLGVK